MAVQLPLTDQTTQMNLQEGFRFSPTDNELLNYLYRKITGVEYGVKIIGDVELYKFDPSDLPSKALFGEKEWYFFCRRDRKYQNGTRPNRMTNSGYWKATGTDKDIVSGSRKRGVKKAMVFYTGNAPTGEKSDWIMHEYRLTEHLAIDNSSMVDDWVLCRIYQKKASEKMAAPPSSSSSSFLFDNSLNNSYVPVFDSGNDYWTRSGAFGLPEPINNNKPHKGGIPNEIPIHSMENSSYIVAQDLFDSMDPFDIPYPTQQSSSNYEP